MASDLGAHRTPPPGTAGRPRPRAAHPDRHRGQLPGGHRGRRHPRQRRYLAHHARTDQPAAPPRRRHRHRLPRRGAPTRPAPRTAAISTTSWTRLFAPPRSRSRTRASASNIARIPTPVAVQADPDRLREILDNLLGNALRHTPPGGAVTVTTTTRPAEVDVSRHRHRRRHRRRAPEPPVRPVLPGRPGPQPARRGQRDRADHRPRPGPGSRRQPPREQRRRWSRGRPHPHPTQTPPARPRPRAHPRDRRQVHPWRRVIIASLLAKQGAGSPLSPGGRAAHAGACGPRLGEPLPKGPAGYRTYQATQHRR